MKNIFSSVPNFCQQEKFVELLSRENVRIERIISQGHSTPEGEWYDQDENEWVMVLQGAGRLLFEDGKELLLEVGDYVNISAHERHRVIWTHPTETTTWLAVFYR
ncbi:cupin domain-containing protein [uncultured Microbulbifer sp.]|uniref:cupin domain-containing protein n=1 Tax=uncultured Microbulbifer sp. TaxID=348147 RepID=UPI0026346C95|nr:cupin domain-containing protein [uncultured Microbulbifer sp.]